MQFDSGFRDDGKEDCLKWTRKHSQHPHHTTTMSLHMTLRKTRLILLKEFLFLVLDDPKLRWISSDAILPHRLTVPSATGNMNFSPLKCVDTSCASRLFAQNSEASICSRSSMYATKMSLIQILPADDTDPTNIPGKTFGTN